MYRAVSGITCISPNPPSHALMLDFQPLSCQATAYTRFPGTRRSGALRGQNAWPAAASRAARTAALSAAAPWNVGGQGGAPGGGRVFTGGGGWPTWTGFFDALVFGRFVGVGRAGSGGGAGATASAGRGAARPPGTRASP